MHEKMERKDEEIECEDRGKLSASVVNCDAQLEREREKMLLAGHYLRRPLPIPPECYFHDFPLAILLISRTITIVGTFLEKR